MPARLYRRLPAHRRVLAVTTTVLALVGGLSVAAAADDAVPSQSEVEDAQNAAAGKARDVSTVQAELAVANAQLDQSSVAAAQAAETYNGTRWRLSQAQEKAQNAEDDADEALRTVREQQQTYSDAIATTYQQAPELSALDGILRADGIEEALATTTTLDQAQTAMGEQYDEFRATATVADVASEQATEARAEAATAEQEAEDARVAAEVAQAAASDEAVRIAEQKTQLIAEMATLQNVSVTLAERRQSQLEAQAAQEAARSRALEVAQSAPQEQPAENQAPTEQADATGQDQTAAVDAPAQVQAAPEAAPEPEPAPEPAPAAPTVPSVPTPPAPEVPSAPEPPTPPAPPAASGSASAAIAFARAQIGEPYVWGAAGPSSWDCSGLTAGAWAASGKYLPHYSVAQYEQSTPISPGDLRPGDLLFWGSSSSPSSIYHVALYIGGGQMIHAPRTGRPVTQESMYYWITPNFYARP